MGRLNGIKMNMKTNCFGIHLTFGSKNIDELIESYCESNKKGYSCLVDINVITNALNNKNYNQIINNASFNTCDGSFLAFLRNIKYNTTVRSYNGPEIFKKYIHKSEVKQLIIGSNTNDIEELKRQIGSSNHIYSLVLPFCDVGDFDYDSIEKTINKLKPKLLWVLLGAPKQELFISRILPIVNSGLIIGAGAALNFYLGRLNNADFSIFGLRFIWLDRLLREPRKQSKRIFKFILTLPKIIRLA